MSIAEIYPEIEKDAIEVIGNKVLGISGNMAELLKNFEFHLKCLDINILDIEQSMETIDAEKRVTYYNIITKAHQLFSKLKMSLVTQGNDEPELMMGLDNSIMILKSCRKVLLQYIEGNLMEISNSSSQDTVRKSLLKKAI